MDADPKALGVIRRATYWLRLASVLACPVAQGEHATGNAVLLARITSPPGNRHASRAGRGELLNLPDAIDMQVT